MVGKNFITKFLDRQRDAAVKFFDKKRIKANDPKVILDNRRKLGGVIRNLKISGEMWYNRDGEGFIIGRSDRCKAMCGHRGRGMAGKLAIGRLLQV